MLRQKHNSSITELGDQIDSLNKLKAKAEKERNAIALELEDMQNQFVNEQNERFGLEKAGKVIQAQIYDNQARQDDISRSLHEAGGAKRKLAVENCDLVHQFEEAERLAALLSKDRTSLTTQLEDAKRLADAETRERINLLGKMKNLQHELDVLKEHLDEEYEAKQEVDRQLSKAFADIQLWKTRYETEDVARAEEIREGQEQSCRETCRGRGHHRVAAGEDQVTGEEQGQEQGGAGRPDRRVRAARDQRRHHREARPQL